MSDTGCPYTNQQLRDYQSRVVQCWGSWPRGGPETGDAGGGDVAQLVERRTGTPLTQVRFPGAARDFSARVNFYCTLRVSVHPLVQSHALTSVRILKILYGFHSSVGSGNTKTPSMYRRLGSATLSQLDFLGGKQPEFAMGEIAKGNNNIGLLFPLPLPLLASV